MREHIEFQNTACLLAHRPRIGVWKMETLLGKFAYENLFFYKLLLTVSPHCLYSHSKMVKFCFLCGQKTAEMLGHLKPWLCHHMVD